MRDVRDAGCDLLTMGQYLRPTRRHHPVIRFYHPDEFKEFEEEGLSLGFKHVAAGPLVRSSYHAEEQQRAAGDRALAMAEA
jgi:lipoic acid synthetase